MAVRIGINGFGRIGRLTYRAILEKAPTCRLGEIEVVAVNDLTDTDHLAHLLKYDSVHGALKHLVAVEKDHISVDGKPLRVYAENHPSKIPWEEMGIDLVIESTGRFEDRESASAHLKKGVRKVVITAPASGADCTLVMGVNETVFDPAKHTIISNASCTSRRPSISGITSPMALAAPVVVGIIETPAARARRRSLWGRSRRRWSFV